MCAGVIHAQRCPSTTYLNRFIQTGATLKTLGRTKTLENPTTANLQNRILIAAFSFALLTMSGFCAEASAQLFYTWKNPAGGNYGSAANWLPGAGAPPDAIDGAEFGLNSMYSVDFFSDFAVSDVAVSAGNVSWD